MTSNDNSFAVLRSVLTSDDLSFLKERCRHTLLHEEIPCFALIDHQTSSTFAKIKAVIESTVGRPAHYLNDFYIYTDDSFRTDWHMDTELFTFENAVNAWILLSPAVVTDPLGILDNINDADERHYHSVKIMDGQYSFRNFRTGSTMQRSLSDLESAQTHTPEIRLGDILVLNPRRFHRTNVSTPKHAFAIKFIYGERKGFLSPLQVPSVLWPEVKTFNDIVSASASWDDVIDGIRLTLKSPEGRKMLSSGFYPKYFSLYKEMVKDL